MAGAPLCFVLAGRRLHENTNSQKDSKKATAKMMQGEDSKYPLGKRVWRGAHVLAGRSMAPDGQPRSSPLGTVHPVLLLRALTSGK